MILGYNQPRPTIENYQNFLDKLVNGLKTLDNGLSLMIFGSYVRGDYTPGRSDIDAVLTFPHNVVIDKDFLHEVSIIFHKALNKKNSSMREAFQVCPLDTTIMHDGRFNSLTDEFYDYFQTEGEVIFGLDYRDEMVCLHLKTGEQSTISHNLRKIRQSLIFSEFDRANEDYYEKFLRGFNATLNATSRGSKQILYLVDGELRKNRFSALNELSNFFPDIDLEPLQRIKHLFYNPEKLDRLYKNPNEVLKVWNSSLTFFEEVIREYIQKYPRTSSPQ